MSRKKQQKKYLSWLFAGLIVLTFAVTQKLNHGNHRGIVLAKNNPIASNEIMKARNDRQWQQVPIAGGGYVTGIYAHPEVADLVYMQTDNGGAYRWQPEEEKWLNMIDDFPLLSWNDYGVEAMALDRHNPELVYLALGKYTASGNGKLWKSSDRGNTWVESDLQVPMGGDEDKRWAGNRLAVSPGNGNILLFGSRTDGLWRSEDAGLHWSEVKSFGAYPIPNIGIIAVAFDPLNVNRVYLSAYGDAIYQSDDAGWTWTKMTGSPVHGMRMVVSDDCSVYVTSDISPGVSKYTNGTWQDITPAGHEDQIFNGLSVHPQDSDRVLVALGEVSNGKIFYSANAGETWQQKSARPKPQSDIPWWPDYFFNDHTSAVVFDPNYPQRVWLGDWFGVWRTDDFQDRKPIWHNYPKGHEQLVTFDLISPPEGAILVSGVADVEGFYHHSLDTYPQDRLGHKNPKAKKHWDRYWQDTYSIAYCATQPLHLVRVGGRRDDILNTGATSSDGGLTWYEFGDFPDDKIPMRVAISADNPRQFIVTRSAGQPIQTRDNGKSWQQVSGLPDGIIGPWNWAQSLAADGVNGNKFYYYAGGTLYRSDDGGVTFFGVNNSLPSVEDHIIKTVPGIEGEVWLSLNTDGLYVSRDGGVSFTAVAQIEKSRLISFGKPSNPGKLPFLYLYGEVSDRGEGLFLSGDRGQTWRKLNDIPLFNNDDAKVILVLEASLQKSGLVFVGTDGRGIYYQVVDRAAKQ